MANNPDRSAPDNSIETQRGGNIVTAGRFPKSNDAYVLPTDSAEHSRLDLQHEAVRLMLGGNLYQQPKLVQAALSPTSSHKRHILDVGTGSGRWAIEMAQSFPDAKALGIDLHLPSVLEDPSRPFPSNCSFKIADANRDMGSLDSEFDLIHQRCVEPGINDADLFFYEAARILHPNGVLLAIGANPQLVDAKGRILPIHKPGDVGSPPREYHHDISRAFVSMLENNPNYSNITIEEVLVPLGPWPGMSDAERKLAETMQQNQLRLWPAFKAVLERDGGFSEEFCRNLSEGGLKEIREMPPPARGYSKWLFATAVRNETPWTARKEPWKEPPGFDIYDYVVRPLPKE
ncbi:hypothetical protein FRC01_011105 [Tulasnella sp. 417]|nr:hypothetical protein FRC01_011105 [Tulasnella sp. 417]